MLSIRTTIFYYTRILSPILPLNKISVCVLYAKPFTVLANTIKATYSVMKLYTNMFFPSILETMQNTSHSITTSSLADEEILHPSRILYVQMFQIEIINIYSTHFESSIPLPCERSTHQHPNGTKNTNLSTLLLLYAARIRFQQFRDHWRFSVENIRRILCENRKGILAT